MKSGCWYIDKNPGNNGEPFNQRLFVIEVQDETCEVMDEWKIRRTVNRQMIEFYMTPEE